MKGQNDIGIIPKKEVDSVDRTLFLKTFFWIWSPTTILFILIYGLIKGMFVSAVISFFGSILVMFITEKIANSSKVLYGIKNANITLREQLEGTLKAAKVAKMNKKYSTAIKIVNKILLQDPDYYEALFVKAQILHEGFNNTDSAKKYLKRVISQTQSNETINNWASSFYDQLNQKSTPKSL